jgi:hypothetical protein
MLVTDFTRELIVLKSLARTHAVVQEEPPAVAVSVRYHPVKF